MTASAPVHVRLLSVAEVADQLGISIDQVRRYIRRKELTAVRFGRRVLVHPDDLVAFIESHRQ